MSTVGPFCLNYGMFVVCRCEVLSMDLNSLWILFPAHQWCGTWMNGNGPSVVVLRFYGEVGPPSMGIVVDA